MPDEVLIEVVFSPVNPSDLMLARGIYALHPALPCVIGNEGVGRVIKLGLNVGHVQVGDRVLIPLYGFAWRERMILPANDLFALPADAELRQLSMLRINPPTASLLLSEYVGLKPGDWVVQNASNSGVGRSVIAFAKARGFKTVNIVRRPELVSEIISAGGDIVVVDGPEAKNQILDATRRANLSLALDGVGGTSTGLLANILSPNGTVVVYSGISGVPLSVSSLDLIFKSITLRGFSLGNYQRSAKSVQAIKEGAQLIASGQLHVPIAATYPLSAIKDAVAHVERGGKVLLEVNNG